MSGGDGLFYIIAEDLLETVYNINKKKKADTIYKIDCYLKGSELVGLKYEPLFNYFSDGYNPCCSI